MGSENSKQFAQFLAMGSIATIAVVARFVARTRARTSVGSDDLFALLALIFYWIYIGVSLWGVVSGPGNSPPAETPKYLSEVSVELKVLYVGIMFTVATISAAKLSVLCLYYRIFQVSRRFRIGWVILVFATITWFLACFLLAVFRCTPIRGAWDPLLIETAKCTNLQRDFLITETINCVTDLAIVLLPVGMIRTLQLTFQLKIGLSFVFLLGGLVCVTSIIRIIYTYHSNGSSDSIVNTSLWVNIQLSAAITCACLPIYRSILPSGAFLTSLRNLYPSLLSRKRSATQSHDSSSLGRTKDYAKYNNLGYSTDDHIMLTNVQGGHSLDHDLAPNAIRVETDLSSRESRV